MVTCTFSRSWSPVWRHHPTLLTWGVEIAKRHVFSSMSICQHLKEVHYSTFLWIFLKVNSIARLLRLWFNNCQLSHQQKIQGFEFHFRCVWRCLALLVDINSSTISNIWSWVFKAVTLVQRCIFEWRSEYKDDQIIKPQWIYLKIYLDLKVYPCTIRTLFKFTWLSAARPMLQKPSRRHRNQQFE